jgi:hypothetical protein
MAFCGKCGQRLGDGARFCRACGAPAGQAAEAVPQSVVPQPPRTGRGVPVLAALVISGIGGVAAWQAGLFDRSGPTGNFDGPSATAPDDDIAGWKSGYSDAFLSGTETLYLTGTANARDYPTSEGTDVLESYPQGASVTGRWVEGRDPAVRWFRVDGGGYIWEGNIGGPDTIYPAGMSGLFVGGDFWSGFAEVDTETCESYDSLDGRFSVMFENGRATSFVTSSPEMATQNGVRVGMSQAELKAAYGDELESELNKYEGMDYYFWRTPERGLRFYVGSSGKIEAIWSGTASIRYVEGCL